MKPNEHKYLNKWLNNMLIYSENYWKVTVPRFNRLRKTKNWDLSVSNSYLNPIREKLDRLKSEIENQLDILNGKSDIKKVK